MAAFMSGEFCLRLSQILQHKCCSFSTTPIQYGKKNFRKFLVYNKRGSKEFRSDSMKRRELGLFHDLGVRPTGIEANGSFFRHPDMIPELIVPDLTGFKLKPYVSYRVPDVEQSEFTSKDLFDACYLTKIINDFEGDKLDENGMSIEPSTVELMTSEEALLKAKQTGSDMFYQKLNIPSQ